MTLSSLAPRSCNDRNRPEDRTYFAFAEAARAASPPAAIEQPNRRTDKDRGRPQVLAGRYRLERLLGAGGMGLVYRARDLLREQFGDPAPHVAIKLLGEEFAECPDASALLYSEYALTVSLRHPHVVRLHSFEIDAQEQCAFIVQELLRGLPLDRLLCEHPQGLPWSDFREMANALLDALAYSHAEGVLHGDLKPSNVMLAEDGLRLFDYGLGQAREGLREGLPKLSRERICAWTPSYAAPELLEGATLSEACDLYSVACVLYEALCGRHPYQRLSGQEAKDRQLDRQLRSPPYLPQRAWRALKKALALHEAERRISVAQLREAFRSLPPSRPRGWFRRHQG